MTECVNEQVGERVSEVSPAWFFRIGTLLSNSGTEVCLEIFVNVSRPPHLAVSREFPFALFPPTSLRAQGPGDCPPYTGSIPASKVSLHFFVCVWHE